MRLAAAVLAVPIAAGAGWAAEPQLGRLGPDVRPVSQAIALVLDPREPDYTGSVDVVLDVVKPVRSVAFHSEEIDILRVALKPEAAASTSIPLTPAPLPDGRIEAAAVKPVPKGRYTLHIDFKNNFDTEAKGLYRLKVGDEWYAFTQFEAIDAREAFPCWDEPSFKIPYRVTLTVPAEQIAIANTAIDHAVEKDGRRTTTFKMTRPLPSYLLALAVGPFELVPIPGTSIPTRIVTVLGQSQSGRRSRRDHAAAPGCARAVLREPASVRQARPPRRSRVLVRRHGESRRDHLRRPDPPPRSEVRRLRGSRAARGDHRARDRPHVVRRSGDDGLVGRPLAERIVRVLDGGQDRRRRCIPSSIRWSAR